MDTKDLLRYVAAVLAKRMRMLAEANCGKCGKPSVGGFVIPTGLQPGGQRTVLSYCDEHKPSQEELKLVFSYDKPWQDEINGDHPGGICCKRATGRYCYEHDPANWVKLGDKWLLECDAELAKSLDPDAIHILPPDAEAWLP